jgi:hypothetical protein
MARKAIRSKASILWRYGDSNPGLLHATQGVTPRESKSFALLCLNKPFDHVVGALIGRGSRFPPQFGQTFFNSPIAQSGQNAHSKLQIMADEASGGTSTPPRSHKGRIFNATTRSNLQ